MKKTYAVSPKVQSSYGWHKHLRKEGKRRAWKSNRRIAKTAVAKNVDNLPR